MRRWLVSSFRNPDLRWCDTLFTANAETAEEAARLVAADPDFIEWFADRASLVSLWACPMAEPEPGLVMRVDPERKYQAQEYQELWDYGSEVEVTL